MSVFRVPSPFVCLVCAAFGLLLSGCKAQASGPLPPAAVTDHPEAWAWLQRYDGTMTRAEFEETLPLFDPSRSLLKQSTLGDDALAVFATPEKTGEPDIRIAFAPVVGEKKKHADFRTPAEFRAGPKPSGRPLDGLRIAIDPGHIGGAWGQIEDRSIEYEGVGRLQEGDLNLITAAILTKELTALGAVVFPTRTTPEPVTDARPAGLLGEARETILKKHPEATFISPSRLELMSHILFERKYEFLSRAEKIRREFPKADVTLVLYINATPSSGSGHLIGPNQNIFFVEGAYMPDEVADPDIRFRMLYKTFARVAPVEYDVAAAIARAFKKATGLPPVPYGNSPTTRLVHEENYDVVARNLGASRQDDGPVITTEPYFMNNRLSAKRFVAGDYEGERTFEGKEYKSIFREYAGCVVDGLLEAYGPVAKP
ncbi:N-acetylmuramoyl-L-alanine amidase [Verrucomicrobium sp. GAS474]|uniref:N-acetylmuramoyl-L-alanine amidase n=1 Tax=Verrucomicrobium sp. GAS474 TaxID=1882831 RepID=UPI000879BAB8|nr:N-acetylmuramoyl-L-alanine amidase [Verrucomicrobium sp. GAS474]SDU09458.1 N-acetylmuramoyl-L-alanine amidase [Verrucomicrobium sp. GAS474]